MTFSWGGIGKLIGAAFLGKIHIDIAVKDEAGNVNRDSSLSFEVVPESVTKIAGAISDMVKDYAKKVVIVSSGFSFGGTEWDFVKKKLFGVGVDIRTVALNQGDKWESPEKQVAKVKAVIDDVVRSDREKVVLIGWGSGGLICHEYCRLYHDDKKVAKLVKIGTPSYGVNSFAQVPESYAIYFVFSPVIRYLDKLGIIEGITKNIPFIEDGMTGMDLMRNIVRNDETINPMNLLGVLLGKEDMALAMQRGSGVVING